MNSILKMIVSPLASAQSIVGHQSTKWDPRKTASEITMHLVQATKESKTMAELNSIAKKHKQSMKANPKRNPGPHFKCSELQFQITCTIYTNQFSNKSLNTLLSRQNYKGIINQQKYMSIVVITCSLQEPYHSKLHNTLGLLLTYLLGKNIA